MSGASLWRVALVGVLILAAIVPTVGLSLAVEAARSIGLADTAFIAFIGAIAILGGSAVVVGVMILWRKPRNRIGLLLATGGLIVMSASAAWPVSIVGSASGAELVVGLATWWGSIGLLPGIALLFPAIGILFPDERLPGAGWRWPVAVGGLVLARGRLQRAVDHRFDRTRYDADRMILEFATRLRDELDLATLTEDLTATTTSAVAPRSAALWLREAT